MKRPNFLVFVPDQWRAKDIGYMGNAVVQTPWSDALAREGVAFGNCFAQNPVCTPSRVSFMTGWYPHVRGHRIMHYVLSPDEPNLLSEMKAAGYFVWWGGKNDLVRITAQEEVCTIRFQPPPSDSYYGPKRWVPGDKHFYSFYRGKLSDAPVHNPDDAIVDEAVSVIRSSGSEPFFLFITLQLPHLPFAIEEPYYSMHPRELIPPPIPVPNFDQKPLILGHLYRRMGMDRLADEDFREILGVYYGMIAKTDANLGRLLQALKESGKYDNTAVFLFSDHGEFGGDYGLVEKNQNTFEDVLTRVPLIIKPAQTFANQIFRTDALVELLDVYATILDMAGIKSNHFHFGQSLVPLLRGQTDRHRDYVFSEGGQLANEDHTHEPLRAPGHDYWPRISVQNEFRESHGKAIMVRDHRWKYVYRLYEPDELYDLRADPNELTNLAQMSQYENTCRKLREVILRWLVQTADVVPLTLDARSPHLDSAYGYRDPLTGNGT
jgi:arylsulfatase A-like enzyme